MMYKKKNLSKKIKIKKIKKNVPLSSGKDKKNKKLKSQTIRIPQIIRKEKKKKEEEKCYLEIYIV